MKDWVIMLAGIVGGGVVAYLINYLWRRKKELAFHIRTITPIANKPQDIAEKLEILFEGKRINDAHLIEVKLSNSGNVPIAPEDFVDNVSVAFGNEARVIVAERARANPEGLPLDIEHNDNLVQVKPLLLNPKESFVLRALVDGEYNACRPAISCRIKGLNLVDIEKRRSREQVGIGIFMALCTLALLLIVLLVPNKELKNSLSIPLGIVVGSFAIFTTIWNDRRRSHT